MRQITGKLGDSTFFKSVFSPEDNSCLATFFIFTSKIQSDSITAHNHFFLSSCSLPKYTHSSLPVRSWSSGEFEVCRTAVTWKKKYQILFFCQQLLKRYPFPLITTIMENIFNPRKTLPQILYIDYISCNICTLKENIRRETERHSREMMER